MKLKNFFLSAAVIVSMVGFTSCSREKKGVSNTSEEPITFKLSLVDPENSNFAKGANKIAEEVEKATNGKIKIDVYAGGSLGGERDTIELAMGNNLDIATAANSVLTNFIPEMGILDQPYLWSNSDQAHAAIDGAVGDLVKREALKHGLHVIGFMESGYRNTFSTKPIKIMADFKGITIRTMENKYHQAAFESFGAMPVAMAYNDVFTALQQKTIDAAENATANCLASGYYEVTKFITNTKHAYVYIVLCMSDAAWKKIPEDLLKPFLDAVQRGVEAQRQYLLEANEEATKELKEKGVQFFETDTEVLKNAYKTKAAEKKFTFDKEWEEAVQKAISDTK